MMLIMKKSYLDLAAFRKANSINQTELAELLGVSRSFISLIETGVNKLPTEKYHRLMELAREREWRTEELCPCLTRIKGLDRALLAKGISRGGKYPLGLSPSIYNSISCGRIGIDDELANEIVLDSRYASRGININRAWLISGEGEMFLPATLEQLDKKVEDLMIKVSNLERMLQSVLNDRNQN